MNVLLLTYLITAAGSLWVLWRRSNQGIHSNQPYLYVVGTIFAGSVGFLLTGWYERESVTWLPPLFFLLFVIIPGLCTYLRNYLVRSGHFRAGVTLQTFITYLVWAEIERVELLLVRSAAYTAMGRPEDAEDMLDRLEEKGNLPEPVENRLYQHRIMLAGFHRDWNRVLEHYNRVRRRNLHEWNSTLIHAARAYAERGQIEHARDLINRLEQRPLEEQEQMAVSTVRLAMDCLRGDLQRSTSRLRQIENQFGSELPDRYFPYWKGRAKLHAGYFREAEELFESALDLTDEDEVRWREAIEEQLREARRRREEKGDSEPRPPEGVIGGSRPEGGRSEFFSRLEQQQGPRPDPEIQQFIHRINRLPRITIVLLVIIGFVFTYMNIGVSLDTEHIGGVFQDHASLIVFGMKADYLIDQEPNQEFSLPELREEFGEQPGGQGAVRMETTERLIELFGESDDGSPEFPKGQYWRLITAVFLHLGLIHILLNGYGLWILGKILENIYGWRDFLSIFLFSGLTGSIASWLHPTYQASAGASGAIFGLLGGLLALMLVRKEGMPERIRSQLLPQLIFWTVLSVAFGYIPGLRIDNAGHIGGLCGGFLICCFLSPLMDAKAEGIGKYIRWTICLLLIGIYGWGLMEGVLFAIEYIPRL